VQEEEEEEEEEVGIELEYASLDALGLLYVHAHAQYVLVSPRRSEWHSVWIKKKKE
jgi:hypothetical protein